MGSAHRRRVLFRQFSSLLASAVLLSGLSVEALPESFSYRSEPERTVAESEEDQFRREGLGASSRAVPEAEIVQHDSEEDSKAEKEAATAKSRGEWLDDEGDSELQLPVVLRWPDAYTGKDPSRVDPSELVLILENRGPEKLRLLLTASLDLAEQKLQISRISEVSPEGGQELRVPFSLTDYLSEPETLKYSGQLIVTAVGEGLVAPAISAPLFFHPAEVEGLLVYSEDLLIGRYSGGDYSGRHQYLEEPGVVTSRVIYGGAGLVSDRRQTAQDVLENDDE